MTSTILRRIGLTLQKFFPRRSLVTSAADNGLLSGGTDVSGALQCGAVWACCRLIAEAISALPGHVYQQTEAGKVKAAKHPLYRMLTAQPNPLMIFPQWVETVVLHLMLYGNAYILPQWDGEEVTALWPVPPDRVRIITPTALKPEVFYRVTDAQGHPHDYLPLEIMHVRLFSLDGIVGLSPIEYQRMSFQIDGLTRLYSAQLYGNGGRPAGVLEYQGNLTKEQRADIRSHWKLMHSGPANAGSVVILEGGTTYKQLAVPPEQLEFIAQQRYSVEQIARIFGVPPHLIGAQDKPTYASVEQQSLEFVQYRLQPIVVNLERTLQSALLEVPFFYKFNLAGFERSDIKTRYTAYATARQWGWMSVNDIRELEDMNRIGPEGDIYLQPLNMIPASAGQEAINAAGTQSISTAGV